MSEVRAAFYLATKERLDRKRSSRGTIKCKAPNTPCGSRCIPPAWDCRLKGEGSDPHLRAVKTDPLKGLAAIERGTKRIASGIAKGSFSDVEGGKAAIIRGTVKIAPGDLQQKKRLQSELENKTISIGIGLAVVTGGLGVHALLMRTNQRYRFSVGNKIEEATREGVNKVLDALPYVGQQRAQTRNTVSSLVSTLAYRTRSEQLQGPLTLRGRLGQGGEAPLSGVSLQSYAESAGALSVQLKQLDDAFAQKPLGFVTWNRAHRKRFWSVTEPLATDNRKPNIFARPAAESYLAKQYNLTNDESSTREAIQSALIGRATADKQALVRLAKQQGYRVRRSAAGEVIDKDDVPAFVSRITGSSLASTPSADSIRRSVEQQLTSIINDSPSDNAKRIYKDTVDGFNQYFESVSSTISNIKRTGVISTQQRKLGYSEIATTADLARANYLASIMNHQHRIAGNAHAELVNLTYYSTRVAGPSDSTYYVSERLARTAASEIAGRSIKTNEEAYKLLTTQYGFTGASRVPIRAPKPPKIEVKSTDNTKKSKVTVNNTVPQDRKTRKKRSNEASEEDYYEYAQWRSRSERVKAILARKGNENMSREAAENLAEQEEEAYYAGLDTERSSMDDALLIRTASYVATRNDLRGNNRQGKPCGDSHIPKTYKCRKNESAKSVGSVNGKDIAIVAGAVGAGSVLLSLGIHKHKIQQYRNNVSKSAIEAEKLAFELESNLRQQAANRLRKKPQDVSGFEASVYNFKDKGFDRGFSPLDNTPAWFGQTSKSKGAVVMLSYADDNKFTTRGQGSFKMVGENKAFAEIWGDRDILPYANNISQPLGQDIDDFQFKQREKLLDNVAKVTGTQGRKLTESVISVTARINRFEFLRKNVNERGFNPDAIRVASFVAAQRRLTGKPVDIMAYSNGGNVATEALAILNEMGYRDVKVVNIAGPTFGIFNHSPDSMKTWVSPGDEFYKYSKGTAFVGGNTRLLRNPNIPHGLAEKIDPNNRKYGSSAKENFKAKNSYLLDEQLQKEAYTFLNVDRIRSKQLVDEVVWRISENKPFEGDLVTLYGTSSTAKNTEYRKLIQASNSSSEVKARIQEEIEDRMIDTWYGGYNAKKVKNARKELQAEVQALAQPPQKKDLKIRRPASLSERVTRLMQQNPGMTRDAAFRRARTELRALKN